MTRNQNYVFLDMNVKHSKFYCHIDENKTETGNRNIVRLLTYPPVLRVVPPNYAKLISIGRNRFFKLTASTCRNEMQRLQFDKHPVCLPIRKAVFLGV